MSTNVKKSKDNNNNQQSNTIKRPLPSGTVTTIRSSMFELGSTKKKKEQ